MIKKTSADEFEMTRRSKNVILLTKKKSKNMSVESGKDIQNAKCDFFRTKKEVLRSKNEPTMIISTIYKKKVQEKMKPEVTSSLQRNIIKFNGKKVGKKISQCGPWINDPEDLAGL